MAGSVYSVSQINAYIKNMFAQDFLLRRIYVKGEVSNCKYHPSGHIYFTLKDEKSAMPCAMFASRRGGLRFRLENGQQVIVLGEIGVYERSGYYQLYASEIRQDGLGVLYERFEALKKELDEMGMFDPAYKQPIPQHVRTLGVVTASSGAALRDIVQISRRRNPGIRIIVYSARVQGEGAAQSIIAGIQALQEAGVDVIIIGRGGGSIEDLWAFNEESVARAVFACRTPVISAVGHETDTVITDFVADLRAPTPSAAAELAVEDISLTARRIRQLREQMAGLMENRLDRAQRRIENLQLQLRILSPAYKLNEMRQRHADLTGQLADSMDRRLLAGRNKLQVYETMLRGLSPYEKLRQGYALVADFEGRRVNRTGQIQPGDMVTLHLSDGSAQARIVRVDPLEE